ncbi:hypothetical protein ABDB91_09535 [Desulfoscipio sp. XC116]|uniref:hypothetical protein n=1 Tax=Desulfoscipio sp. XC116 TaxID=3144975 RepID=UPI00325A92ED
MNKKTLMAILLFLIIVTAFIWSNSPEDYGSSLPPMLSPEIPVIDGEIITSKEAKFEVTRGYIIKIKTKKSFNQTVEFYKSQFEKTGTTISFHDVISEEKVASAEAAQGSTIIYLEIIDKKDYTLVIMAIHL